MKWSQVSLHHVTPYTSINCVHTFHTRRIASLSCSYTIIIKFCISSITLLSFPPPPSPSPIPSPPYFPSLLLLPFPHISSLLLSMLTPLPSPPLSLTSPPLSPQPPSHHARGGTDHSRVSASVWRDSLWPLHRQYYSHEVSMYMCTCLCLCTHTHHK